jgi:hypothetical protein
VSAIDYLARAYGFIYAASDVIEARRNQPTFRAPILHMLAHGAELLFKGVHLSHGATPDELKKQYGHDIWACWEGLPDGAGGFRQVVEREARDTWTRAEKMGMVPEDTEFADGAAHFRAMLRELSQLHNKETNFALRYPEAGQKGMVPLHLRDTLAQAVSWAIQARQIQSG